MATEPEDRVGKVVRGIDGLQKSYLLERKVFLGGIVLGLLLGAFFSVMTAFGFIEKEAWLFAFGPSGVIVGTCTAAMTYFNKSLSIIDRIAGGRRGE